jgi:Domain of unknown function (DUF4280)
MSGLLLDAQATVLCAHAGQARPAVPSTRVQLGGQAAVMLPVVYTVAGCSLPPNAGGPCATAQWTTGATKVLIEGSPALLTDSTATCVPTGTPLNVVSTQTRVQGS